MEKLTKRQQTSKEYNEWVKEVNDLNDKINLLSLWDDYAERLQSRYDKLLQDPRGKLKS